MKRFDRLQYMGKLCTFDEYYGQFVNSSVQNYVVSMIGHDAIMKSEIAFFNDIGLKKWEKCVAAISKMINRELFRTCNNVTYPIHQRNRFIWSIADGVCIAKASAKMYREKSQK